MAAVSQALVEFANHHRAQPAPGIEVIVTPRYQITLQPDFPIAGPNNVSWIRCRPREVDEVIREARATISPHHLPVTWTLDPGIYRALVAARLEIARRAGVSGLAVWGGNMSAPILGRLGFETVGWRRFYLDTTTA